MRCTASDPGGQFRYAAGMPTPADVYEDLFAPGMFRPWAEWVIDRTALRPGERVVDIACGPGVGARIAAERVGDPALVKGCDINEGMIETARRRAPEIEWATAPAEDLPYGDDSFDVALCLLGLMFFPEKVGALAEMRRVVAPGGRVVVTTWASHEHCPGFGKLAAALERHFGADVAKALQTPFSMGDSSATRALFREAGFAEVSAEVRDGEGRFASLRDWVTAVVRGWMDFNKTTGEDALEALLRDCESELAEFVERDGQAVYPMRGLIYTARV